MNVAFVIKPFFIEPLGIMCLISVLKENKHNVKLITTDNIKELFSIKNIQMVCYSIMTGDQRFYNEINSEIKIRRPEILTVAGGPHPTFFPEMIDDPKMTFDAICIGEGEGAIIDLANHINPDYVKNIWTRNKKNIVRPLIKDLDEYPYPDRKEVFKIPEIKNGPIKHFIAGRLCAYDCSYCFNQAYGEIYKGEKRVRFRDPRILCNEIGDVFRQSPTKVVYFQDDTFITNKKWLREFTDIYKHWVNLPYHCHCRADLVNEEVVKLLADSRCISVHLAAETGDERIRKSILNRNMTDEQIINACSLFRKYNIKVMLQNIIGLPGTSFEHDIKTLELNIRCKPDYAWVSIFQPYPKTKLGEYAKSIGEYTGDFSDIGSSFFDKSPLRLPEWRKNRISNLQKLFAFAVKNPVIYESGTLIKMLDTKSEDWKDSFAEIYKRLRKDGDRMLYGVDL